MSDNRGTSTNKDTIKNRLLAGAELRCNKCDCLLDRSNIRQYKEHYVKICRTCHNKTTNSERAKLREDSNMRKRIREYFFRSCLNCDASFNTSNRYLRLCSACRSQSIRQDIEMHRLYL